jgi:SAM-dependent methyltransferase
MDGPSDPPAYNRTFEDFNDPLMQRFRELAYGEDIGQHSWTNANELREFSASIEQSDDIADFGCGAGGPLTFIVKNTGCRGAGWDLSESALQVARVRAKEMGLSERVSFYQADLDTFFTLPLNKLDAAIAIDVILHLRDRFQFLSEVSRVLKPGGTFIFTDAGVMTGTMTEKERKHRTLFGRTEFVTEGVNEESITRAGFTIQSVIDSTNQLIANAGGRLRARQLLSKELIALEGPETFHKQVTYLETVVDLAQRRILSRLTYTSSTQSLG